MDYEFLFGLLKFIIPAVIILGIASYCIQRIKRTYRRMTNSAEAQVIKYAAQALKTGDINDKLSTTPKSLSSMDSIYLPQIQKDFPEFNWNEFKPLIKDTIIDYLVAIDIRDSSALSDRPNIKRIADDFLMQTQIPNYKDIKVHNTVIKRYFKKDGTCYIQCESSVEYYGYTEEHGTLIRGNKTQKKQSVYETELVYIQDVNKSKETGVSVTCPNCGAPITNLGAKFCEYCGTGIEPLNTKVWTFNSIQEN